MSSDHKKDVKAFPYTTNNEKFQVKLVGDATTFDVSGLAFYQDNNAFAYDGKVYGGKGKTVTFDVTNSNGQVYPISDIKVNGTNVSKGDGGHFSWTTENNAVLDINFDDDTTTGISSVATGAASRGNATTDGTWYTLDGRKLDGKPTTKGIFIVNGRKVVIK